MLLKAVGRETGRVALLPGNKLNATVTGQYFSLKGCLTLLGFSGSETITQSKKRSFQTGMRPIPVCGQKGKNCPSSCPHPSCEWRGDYAPTHTHTHMHTRTHATQKCTQSLLFLFPQTRVPRGHHAKGDFPGEPFAKCEFGGDYIYNPTSISKS